MDGVYLVEIILGPFFGAVRICVHRCLQIIAAQRAKQQFIFRKARLHMRFFMRLVRCDFDAILRAKPASAYPARVFSRVTLRQNTVKLAEIRKKGVFK